MPSPHPGDTPRVCFLSPGRRAFDVLGGDTRQSGGAEAQLARIARVFAERGHAATLIYGSGGDGHSALRAGVTCVDAYPAWRRAASIVRFWRLLDTLRPALLYARLPDDFLALAALYAAVRPGVRLVYSLANDQFCNPWRSFDYKAWFHNPLYALALRWAPVVAVQHAGQIPLVRPYVGGELMQLPNLAPSPRRAPRALAETRHDVIWLAQIRPTKRLRLLLDLAASLPQLRFAVVGGFDETTPPAEQQRLREQMAQLPNLRFYDAQPATVVAELLSQSRLLVNTSSHEGFPNSMLEAWNLGLPVVSLAVDPGGVIVRERLGAVSGSPAQLVADVARLCTDEALNAAAGARGRAYVQRQHSVEAVYAAFAPMLAPRDRQGSASADGGI